MDKEKGKRDAGGDSNATINPEKLPRDGDQRAYHRVDQPKEKSKKKRYAGRDSDVNQQSTARNCSSTVTRA
jgi:hypothetical protein